MELDGLHIVWATYNYWQPQRGQGIWRSLQTLYAQLEQAGHDCQCSKSLPKIATEITDLPNDTIVLTASEVDDVSRYLAKLIAPGGDRIVAGLPVRCLSVTPTFVQLLMVPALDAHSQAIGRIKSQTSSKAFREWGDQQRLWSSGYWFANIKGEAAIAEVEQFIQDESTSSFRSRFGG